MRLFCLRLRFIYMRFYEIVHMVLCIHIGMAHHNRTEWVQNIAHRNALHAEQITPCEHFPKPTYNPFHFLKSHVNKSESQEMHCVMWLQSPLGSRMDCAPIFVIVIEILIYPIEKNRNCIRNRVIHCMCEGTITHSRGLPFLQWDSWYVTVSPCFWVPPGNWRFVND